MNIATYRSFAKINLYLDVLDRRPDGFTNIETVFQSIDLWDVLRFAPAESGIAFTCSDPALADPAGNLVVRAAEGLRAYAGVNRGAVIHLEKRIPVAAGLAGGSGNAAAALVALNELWQIGLSDADLAVLAADLGSDVPFCLIGGTVAATGRGEVLELLPPIPPHWLVLVHPPLAITAAEAYGHPELTRSHAIPENGKTPAFRDAIQSLERGELSAMVFNRMESGIFHDYPVLEGIKSRLLAAGCTASAMSGSGPTIFGVCTSEVQARAVASTVSDYPVTVLRTANSGIAACG